MIAFKKYVLGILSVIFLLTGCNVKLHKDFGFTELTQDLGWGVVHGKLRGTMSDLSRDSSITGSPYELLLWFSVKDTDSVKECSVAINNLSLSHTATAKTVLTIGESKSRFTKEADGTQVAYFSFKKIDLDYSDLRLAFNYYGSDTCKFILDAKVDFVLKLNYQEKRISFWDSLMGV